MRRIWLGTLLAVLLLPSSALATVYGDVALGFSTPTPFNVVAQQLTIVHSPPGLVWSLGGTMAAVPSPFNTGPGNWTMGVLTPFHTRSGVREPAHTVFRQQGAFGSLAFKLSITKRACTDKTQTLLCIDKILPYAPGDTYELLYGGTDLPYGPVIRDETLKYDVFTSLEQQPGFYPQLGALYDSAQFLNKTACRRQHSGLARIAPPVLDDYSLLGPPLFGTAGSTADPAGAATVGGAAATETCEEAPTFAVGPSYGLASEAQQYRRLPHVKFAINATWNPSATRITHFKPLHAKAPMYFEVDCEGKHCPFGSVRGRYRHLKRLERRVEHSVFAPGDELNVFVGTYAGCGPTCEWGQQLDIIELPRNRPPKLALCQYSTGLAIPKYSCGKKATA